jgi:hypothetical protein
MSLNFEKVRKDVRKVLNIEDPYILPSLKKTSCVFHAQLRKLIYTTNIMKIYKMKMYENVYDENVSKFSLRTTRADRAASKEYKHIIIY